MFSKRNVSNNLRLAILLVLSAGIILSFATGALAQGVFETWSGDFTIQIKSTALIEGKLTTKSKSLPGRLDLFTDVDGRYPISNGATYMQFIGYDMGTDIYITQLVLINNLTQTSDHNNVKFLAVGVGTIYDPNSSGNPSGIVYLDLSGSYKAAAGKKPATISLVIKMGGGRDGEVVFSANPKVTLTKQTPE